MLNKRKGISTFIATLLLMVLAVSAGVVIYAYTMGYMGGFGGTDTLGAISLDEASMDTTQILPYVRNIGKTDVNITTVYVDGELVAGFAPVQLTEGTVDQVPITYTTGTVGKTYEVKLICEDNTQLSFSVKCEA
jgi:hypothetical protein